MTQTFVLGRFKIGEVRLFSFSRLIVIQLEGHWKDACWNAEVIRSVLGVARVANPPGMDARMRNPRERYWERIIKKWVSSWRILRGWWPAPAWKHVNPSTFEWREEAHLAKTVDPIDQRWDGDWVSVYPRYIYFRTLNDLLSPASERWNIVTRRFGHLWRRCWQENAKILAIYGHRHSRMVPTSQSVLRCKFLAKTSPRNRN